MHQTSPSALRIFSVALLCQSVAGVEYWWPALLTSLQPLLHISATQSLILTAIANSGSTLSIPAGLFHSYYGSRKTALLGSISLSFCFLILAFLPLASKQFMFPTALVITSVTVPASYALYAGALSLSSAVFLPSFRGRVVGLQTAAYAASAAIYAAIQLAFFPDPQSSTRLLITCASITTFAAILITLFFPLADDFDPEPQNLVQQTDEYIPHAHQLDTLLSGDFDPEPQRYVQQTDVSGSHTHQLDILLTTRIESAYKLIWILVAVLQLIAISDALSAPSILLRVSVLAIASIMFLLLTSVPYKSPLCVRLTLAGDIAPSEGILHVVKDTRFQYLAIARFLIIGGGGIILLVQSHNIVASRFALTQPDAIPAAVRTVVMIFTTSNLTGRLLSGMIMDAPTAEESLIRKYNILHTDSLIVAVTLPLLAIVPYWFFLLGVVVIGMCHGIYFSTAPALCTLWFGVREYPRNWSALGPFQLLAIATIASSVPGFIMKEFGKWVTVGEEKFCIGVMCTLPTFALIGVLQLMLYGVGWLLKKRLQT